MELAPILADDIVSDTLVKAAAKAEPTLSDAIHIDTETVTRNLRINADKIIPLIFSGVLRITILTV